MQHFKKHILLVLCNFWSTAEPKNILGCLDFLVDVLAEFYLTRPLHRLSKCDYSRPLRGESSL